MTDIIKENILVYGLKWRILNQHGHTKSFINHLSMVNSKGKEMVAILQRIDLKNLFHTFLNYRSKKYGIIHENFKGRRKHVD